jgi:hypothetical protein
VYPVGATGQAPGNFTAWTNIAINTSYTKNVNYISNNAYVYVDNRATSEASGYLLVRANSTSTALVVSEIPNNTIGYALQPAPISWNPSSTVSLVGPIGFGATGATGFGGIGATAGDLYSYPLNNFTVTQNLAYPPPIGQTASNMVINSDNILFKYLPNAYVFSNSTTNPGYLYTKLIDGASGYTGATSGNINIPIQYVCGATSGAQIDGATGSTICIPGPIGGGNNNEATFNTAGMKLNAYGNTFLPLTGATSTGVRFAGNIVSTAISATGQWQVVATNNAGLNNPAVGGGTAAGYLYVSNNFGLGFRQVTTASFLDATANNFRFVSVAINSTGQYISAGIAANEFEGGGYTWISSNYGANFNSGTAFSEQARQFTAFSSAAYPTIGAPLPLAAVIAGYSQYVSNGRLYISRQIPSNNVWIDQENLYISGATGYNGISSIAISASGKYVRGTMAGPTGKSGQGNNCVSIYSNDFANNWFIANSTTGDARFGVGIAMSSNGQYQTIITNGVPGATVKSAGYIWTSANYGATFTQNTSPDVSSPLWWKTISMSSTGQYQSAAALTHGIGITGPDYIYTSSNFGNTWTKQTQFGSQLWSSVAVSGSGQYQVAGGATGNTSSGPTGSTGSLFAYSISNPLTPVISNTDGVTGATGLLFYNTTNNTLFYNTTKTFVIDNPVNPDKYLVHGCLEGPEAGVYYRGKAEIVNGYSTTIELPYYVSSFATDFFIQVTPIYNGKINIYNTSEIDNNKFTVYGDNGEFFWLVKGRRMEIDVDPNKSDVEVKGKGPYRWI